MEAQLENYSKAQLIALLQQEKKKASKSEKKTKLLEDENAYLKYQVEQLKRLAFGQKRERFEGSNSPQLALPFEESAEVKAQREEVTKEKITYERKKANPNHHGRQPLPAHLPVEEYPPDQLHVVYLLKILGVKRMVISWRGIENILEGMLEPQIGINLMLFADGEERINTSSALCSLM